MTRAGTKHATAADLTAEHARHGTKVGHAVPLAAAKAALRVLYRGALPAAGQTGMASSRIARRILSSIGCSPYSACLNLRALNKLMLDLSIERT
jgi:hypothetical protein